LTPLLRSDLCYPDLTFSILALIQTLSYPLPS
jgi:hypothetical protein